LDLPLIGSVDAEGQSVREVRQTIATRLAGGYLRNPKVALEVLNYRPIYVHGEVKSGGEFTYRTGMRLRDAIAVAGGFTYRADQTFVQISRQGRDPQTIGATSNFVVKPGDNIRIPERYF
jgi:protein involved in polysaccharide export with SLBB domain